MDVPLRCQCGAFEGVATDITPSAGLRANCYCDDCQAFAHHLGRAHDVLDENGGSDIFGTTPARVKILRGTDQLRCLRLSTKGLFRWYVECCQTPLANTMAKPKMAYAGLYTIMMDFEKPPADIDATLGELKYGLQGRFAIGPLPSWASQGAPLGFLGGVAAFILKSLVYGGAQPSPFFSADFQPRVTPKVLNREEREILRPLCGPTPHDQPTY